MNKQVLHPSCPKMWTFQIQSEMSIRRTNWSLSPSGTAGRMERMRWQLAGCSFICSPGSLLFWSSHLELWVSQTWLYCQAIVRFSLPATWYVCRAMDVSDLTINCRFGALLIYKGMVKLKTSTCIEWTKENPSLTGIRISPSDAHCSSKQNIHFKSNI